MRMNNILLNFQSRRPRVYIIQKELETSYFKLFKYYPYSGMRSRILKWIPSSLLV